MNLSKKSFISIILCIIILPLLGNEQLLNYLHINSIATLLNYILPSLVCLFAFIDTIKQKYKPKLNLLTITTICFWITLFISLILSISKEIYNFTNLYKFICMTFIILILSNVNLENKQKKVLFYTIIGTSTFISIIGILQYILNIGLTTNGIEKYIGAIGRINSTTYIATILDKYLTINIFVTYYVILNKEIKNYVSIPSLIIQIAALCLTFSRTGLLIYIFITFIYLLIYLFKKNFLTASIVLILLIGTYFIPGEQFVYSSIANYLNNICEKFSNKTHLTFIKKASNCILDPLEIDISNYYEKEIEKNSKKNSEVKNKEEIEIEVEEKLKTTNHQLISNTDDSLNSRTYYGNIAKDLIKNHPYFGIGIGSYTYIYEKQNINNYVKNGNYMYKFLYPHNMYLQLGAEIGIPGMILFFSIFVISLFKDFLKNKNILIFIFLISILLTCYTETIFYMKETGYLFIILIALLFKKTKKE